MERIEDKHKFLNNCDLNELIGCLRETKMAIENEMDDLQRIKGEMTQLNTVTHKDACKIDKKIGNI